MIDEAIQLEFNFNENKKNHFQDRLEHGEFQISVELPIPSGDTPLEDAVRKYANFEYFIHEQKEPATQIAFTSDFTMGETLDPAIFSSALCKFSRDGHIIFISGKNRTIEQIENIVNHAKTEGFRNFCAVTGAAELYEKDIQKTRFTDSINIMRALRSKFNEEIQIGATCNPFQYNIISSYAQSLYIFRKILNGATFITAQMGWDALKLQELVWNLYRRDVNIPLMARIFVLTPTNVNLVCANEIRGVHPSSSFLQMLKEERKLPNLNFMEKELRRIQIHAVGAKLLGYSGIQIAGTTDPALLSLIFKKIRMALREFSSFEDWKDCYWEYYNGMNMAPDGNHFYLFDNLLKEERLQRDPGMPTGNLPPLELKEKLRYKIAKILLKNSHLAAANERMLTKKILCDCQGCEKCSLSQTNFICRYECPKGLTNGHCGDNHANGKCYMTGDECFFAKRIRFASYDNNLGSLGEGYVKM